MRNPASLRANQGVSSMKKRDRQQTSKLRRGPGRQHFGQTSSRTPKPTIQQRFERLKQSMRSSTSLSILSNVRTGTASKSCRIAQIGQTSCIASRALVYSSTTAGPAQTGHLRSVSSNPALSTRAIPCYRPLSFPRHFSSTASTKMKPESEVIQEFNEIVC